MAALVAFTLASLALSALAALSEAVLLGLGEADIAWLGKARPRAARTLAFFQGELSSIALAARAKKVLLQCAGAAAGGALAFRLRGATGLVSFALAYGLLLAPGAEILARGLGARYARALAPGLAFALTPLVWVQALARHSTARPGRRTASSRRGRPGARALEQVSALVRLAAAHGSGEPDQDRVFQRARDLSQLTVRDVMVDRAAVKFLSTAMSLSQALVEAHRHHHTRFPLLREGALEEVVGYVNFKDIVAALQLNPANPTLEGIRRPILSVRADHSLSSLLDRLTREYQHIAVVRNRRGAMVGLATLEDALEAVLGGASREASRLPDYCYPIAADRWVAGGGVSVQTLRGELGLNLPDLDETLDSLLRQLCGGTPTVEQRAEVMGTAFSVRRMSGTHVREALIEAPARQAT